MTITNLKKNLILIKKDKVFLFIVFLIFLMCLLKVIFWFFNFDMVSSSTNSDQNGIYFVNLNKPKPIVKGEYVAFCISDQKALNLAYKFHLKSNGICKNHSTPLLKHVCALPGDTITINSNNDLLINGILQNNLKVIQSNKLYYKTNWKNGYKLKEDEYFICGTNKLSFDSRYLGAININDIVATAILLKGY